MRGLGWLFLALLGCTGTTGGSLVSFAAVAGGPPDAIAGQPLSFQNALGFHIVLNRARLHLGAVYLGATNPTGGGPETPCVAADQSIYVGEAFGPVDVDLLSPGLNPFPGAGEGTATHARVAEVWLTDGDVNAPTNAAVILDVAGTADKGGVSYPFIGAVTISANRALPVQNPGLPGSSPICHQRIVSPILVDILPTNGGTLQLRADPRQMFGVVDFSTLSPITTTPLQYQIPDTQAGAGEALFKGLLANAGVYSFSWSN